MPRCPGCASFRIVIVIGPTRRAFCAKCGTRWVQEGSIQRAVEHPRREVPSEPQPA
jgi:transposase-like protein